MIFRRLIVILITTALICACSANHPLAELDDKAAPPSRKIKHHIVASGETLYSIAWRYNLDIKRLAKANGVENTYTIFPGQRLTLDLNAIPKQTINKNKTAKVNKPAVVKKRTPTPVAVAKPKPPPVRSTNTTTPVNKPSSSEKKWSSSKWNWPCQCRLIAGFKGAHSLQKGIDLKAKLGEPIYAAATGEVVYSGDGLRGYGKLLIVKHSEVLLSAYAHNQVLLVKEGDSVKAGQKIAKMGKSGTNAVKLHFEVRLDGKPVNPLKYLPKRHP